MKPYHERFQGGCGVLLSPALERIGFKSDGEWFLGIHDS